MSIFSKDHFYVCSSKLWMADIAERLSQPTGKKFHLIQTKEQLQEALSKGFRQTLFFVHWSFILKEDVYNNHDCVMFHMTDLPFGRGGSPLQNLIIRGHQKTQISSFLCDGGVDTGPIFIKKPLDLQGRAVEIFERAQSVMLDMIVELIQKKPTPQPQMGEVTEFKRRTADQGDLQLAQSYEQIYDMIRMLDAPGYPAAFLKTKHGQFEFYNVQMIDGEIKAEVRIKK